jgi:hypothetical protein
VRRAASVCGAPNCPNVAVRAGRCLERAPKPWAGSEQSRDRRGVLRGHAKEGRASADPRRRRTMRALRSKRSSARAPPLGELSDYGSTLVLWARRGLRRPRQRSHLRQPRRRSSLRRSRRDRLSGGRGNDVLVGDWGRDRLSGESGNDTLLARDGRADKAFGATGSTAIGSIGGSTTRGRSRRGSELRTIGIWREHIETDPKR